MTINFNFSRLPVGDLFFEYERGQKLGLWVMAMDCGFLLGPLSKCLVQI